MFLWNLPLKKYIPLYHRVSGVGATLFNDFQHNYWHFFNHQIDLNEFNSKMEFFPSRCGIFREERWRLCQDKYRGYGKNNHGDFTSNKHKQQQLAYGYGPIPIDTIC